MSSGHANTIREVLRALKSGGYSQ